MPGEIDPNDTRVQDFEQAQTRPVKQRGNQAWGALLAGRHYLPGQRHGKALRATCPREAFERPLRMHREMSIQEPNGIERLVLRGGRHAPLRGRKVQIFSHV